MTTRRPQTCMGTMAKLSLQDIEHDDWGDPATGETPLVRTCLALRRTPLGQFDDEDLRIMLGQQISVAILVPVALGMLLAHPWLGGDMLPGALLARVARVDDEYWLAHPDQAATLNRVVDSVVMALMEDPGIQPDTSPDAAPGDALSGVMGIPARYWLAQPDQQVAMRQIIPRASTNGLLDEDDWEFADPIFAPLAPQD